MRNYQVRSLKATGKVKGTATLERLQQLLALQAELYNACLYLYRLAQQKDPDRYSRFTLQKELTLLRASEPEFAGVTRRIQDNLIAEISTRWQQHVRGKAGKPRYRVRRYRTISLDSPQGKVIRFTPGSNPVLQVPSLPAIRLQTSQLIPPDQQPVSVRITLKGKHIEVRLGYRFEIPDAGNPEEAVHALGIDLGIALSVATSTGVAYRSPRQEYLEGQVVKARRKLSHIISASLANGRAGYRAVLDDQGKQMLSNKKRPMRRLVWAKGEPPKSYLKARRRLSELSDRLASMRNDFRHRTTNAVIREASSQGIDLLAMEDLQVASMTRSARGTEANPGRNVRAKSGLNRTILQEAWGGTLLMLEYKAERAGIPSIRVGAQGTSITCSSSGHKDPKSRRSQASFHCTSCGHQSNADLNASVNIADRGLLYFQKRHGLTIEELRLARTALKPSGGAEGPESGPAGQPASYQDQERLITASISSEPKCATHTRAAKESFAIF